MNSFSAIPIQILLDNFLSPYIVFHLQVKYCDQYQILLGILENIQNFIKIITKNVTFLGMTKF